MVKVKIATNSVRKEAIVSVDTTVEELLENNNVSTVGVALHLDGAVVMPDEYDLTLDELGIEDESEATLVAIVKADSAL